MKTLTLGSFLAALAMFVFGAAFWICPLPYRVAGTPSLGDEALGRLLKDALPKDGLYLVPGVQGKPEEIQSRYRQGPVATIHYHSGGVEPMSPPMLVRGFLLGWATTGLLALLLRLGGNTSYWSRVLQVAAAGAAAALYLRIGDGIWWYQPWPWLVLTAGYDLAVFTLAGLVLAKFVRPAAVATATVA